MTDSEKSKISINYWLVPIIGILVFLVSGVGFGWFILLQMQAHGLHQGDYFRFGHFQLYLLGVGGGIFAIAIIAISAILAAVTTMLTISWGPKIFSILKSKRK